MNKLNTIGGKCFFMGSSEKVLALIKQRVKVDYPNIEVETYSPPYKPEFSEEDNRAIVEAINKANPDLLWIGMTAPKQEKWAYTHWHELKIHCHCGTIGAVFDFYAGTVKRAPAWWQRHSLEWCYRLLKNPAGCGNVTLSAICCSCGIYVRSSLMKRILLLVFWCSVSLWADAQALLGTTDCFMLPRLICSVIKLFCLVETI